MMNNASLTEIEKAALQLVCTNCGAAPNAWCTSSNDRRTLVLHAVRTKAARRGQR